MQCPYCGAPDQSGHFCEKCGKALDAESLDLTRVMPPLKTLHKADDQTADDNDTTADGETPAEAAEEAGETPEDGTADAAVGSESETPDADEADAIADEEETADEDSADDDADDSDTSEKPALPAFLTEDDDAEESALTDGEDLNRALRKKALTIVALVIGIALAAVAAVYLFTDIFDTNPEDPAAQVKNADTIAPDTSLAEDTIVGHWRNYNTGSVIEKIGTGKYRWRIGDKAYPLEFKENSYVFEDENGSTYTFVLTDADHIQLAASSDANGGLITNPIFESGFIAGRVGQDGTMAKSMSINADAFNIVGKTYAELAGTYGPGSLSVIGDDQYIVFRGEGGNFAVQFEGETVPLAADAAGDVTVSRLAALGAPLESDSDGYHMSRLTATTSDPSVTYPTVDDNTTEDGTGTTDNGGTTTTTPPAETTPTTPDTSTTDDSTGDDEDTEYTVEIPDMPTFPSTSAVATGVVWADLGFVIKNAPDTMSVEDLSAVLGIALEVGTAPANESGFTFYGMSDGYFTGSYASGDHTYNISGYGNANLDPSKTILFIQQLS